MIEVAKNPNTGIPSVAIRMTGYFGMGQDGLKLVDQDTIFLETHAPVLLRLPSEAFNPKVESNQNEPSADGENTDKNRDSKGRFVMGNKASIGNKGNKRTTIPLTERLIEVLENKYYEKKGTGEKVLGMDILAEAIIDNAVLKGNTKLIDLIFERIEGKVTQSVKLSGSLEHGVADEKEVESLVALFPDKK